MEPKEEKEIFTYTYSVPRQEEIKAIRQKYLPPEEDKMETLRRLDEGVERRAGVVALCVGILSALVLGVGMCCCMVWMGPWFIPGVLIGFLGILGVSLAYPVYRRVLARERARVASEILRLAEELLQQ